MNTAPTNTVAPGASADGKRRLSLFSFHLSGHVPKSKGIHPISTLAGPPPAASSLTSGNSNTNTGPAPAGARPRSPQRSASCCAAALKHNRQLNSPVFSPVSPLCLTEKPGLDIFERSVQDMAPASKQEDYIPPALDATALILSDKDTDLDNVEMVYSLRGNSSVIGLNMALGRPYTPLRKNSVYSLPLNPLAQFSGSQSSLSYTQPQTQSPVSPPKLNSSRSSVSFYLYADMINNDEYSRRPSFMYSYSHNAVPSIGRKASVVSNHSVASNGNTSSVSKGELKCPRKASVASSHSQSQLSKQLKDRVNVPQVLPENLRADEAGSLKKFLISPESSDSEEAEELYYPDEGRQYYGRRKSVTSGNSIPESQKDQEDLVLTSVGDCIRRTTSEIVGN